MDVRSTVKEQAMNTMQKAMYATGRFFGAAAAAVLTTMLHPRASLSSWMLLNRTKVDYAREVDARANSIVISCVRWVQRVFTEAPPIVERWVGERQEWEQHVRDDVLDLLERPNGFYNGATLWKATVADLLLTGSAYWVKVRSASGRVVQLWWVPESLMEPKADPNDPTVFISHYEYRVDGTPVLLRDEDVVQFRDGIDPGNPRKGLSAMKSLMREIFTDDEAANMTASLLRNMGVPGVIISPKSERMGADAADHVKEVYKQKFSGDMKGEVMVMEGATEIQQFGYSPEQMGMRSLRGIPEERITAVLGVNAAVVGLGAGLSTTKVGATLREYREEAFESTIIPMYRELGSELTHQLLGDFDGGADARIVFDLSKVRVLQDDENKRAERIRGLVTDGVLTVAEGRRTLGYVVADEHEVYLRRRGFVAVPTGQSPDEQAEGSRQLTTRALALRRDAERLEAALADHLTESRPEDVRAVLEAHYLLTAETTFATLGQTMPEDLGARLAAEARSRPLPVDIHAETANAQRMALESAEVATPV